jgi:hypothetical protein
MSKLDHQLAEDRALRDAALALFKADLAFIRTDLREKGVGTRLADRLGEGTRDMVDDAVDYAEANSGKVAAGALAVIMWFARGPNLDPIGRLFGDDDNEAEEPAVGGDRSGQKRSREERQDQ